MNHKSKGTWSLIAAILDFIISMFLFFIIQQAKNEWSYYYNKDAQSGVAVLSCIAWFLVIAALAEFIAGICHFVQAEKDEETPNTNQNPPENAEAKVHLQPQQRNSEPIDQSKMETCMFCGKLTDKNNPICQHCGRRKD